MTDQMLDSMDLERERGITIKAQPGAPALPAPRTARTIRAQPHRHAGPRRFHLRGVAQPGRLRGRAAGRRCRPGRRGADRGQRLPGDRHNLEIIPVINKIDLPQRRSGAGQAGDRRRHRHSTLPMRFSPAPRRASASRRFSKAIVRPFPAAQGDPDAPLQALDLRQLVRSLPRRGGA